MRVALLLTLSACWSAGCAADVSQSIATPESSIADLRRGHGSAIEHVLLLSVDGLHQLDLQNFLKAHPASALAQLAQHGTQYDNAWVNALDGTPTNPSDSFPGLLALTTGGSSRTHGGWYDVSYARELFPYNAAAPCSGSPGTMVTFDESVELDSDAGFPSLWGSTDDNTPTHDVEVVRSRIDPTKLPYAKSAQRVARRSIRTSTYAPTRSSKWRTKPVLTLPGPTNTWPTNS